MNEKKKVLRPELLPCPECLWQKPNGEAVPDPEKGYIASGYQDVHIRSNEDGLHITRGPFQEVEVQCGYCGTDLTNHFYSDFLVGYLL